MKEAIRKSTVGATTVIKRSKNVKYDAPSIIICPQPGYKQSGYEMYNLSIPARILFDSEKYGKDIFSNHSVYTLKN